MTDLQILCTADDPGPAWDTFVAGHPAGHLMQSRAWAAVRRDTGWTPLFLRLEQAGAIRGAALLLRWRPPVLPATLLYIPRGPVLDYGDATLCDAFAAALAAAARVERAFLIQTDPAIPAGREEAHAALERMGFQREEKHGLFRISQPIRVMRIPLDRYGGPEGLLAALPHKTRYNIGLAQRKGGAVVARTDHAACLDFHRLLQQTGRTKGFPVRGLRFHEALWRYGVQADQGEYLFATHQGRVLAAVQLLWFGPIAWYMYGASAGEDRNLMPTYLLHWEAIRRMWNRGIRCYDMRGVYSATPHPGDPEYGVYNFKRKFNAELISFLGEYDLPIRPGTYRTWRRLETALQRPAGWALRWLTRRKG